MLNNSSSLEFIEKKPVSRVELNSIVLSRRSFFKGSVGLAAAAFTADKLISPAHAQWRFREYLPYDAAGDYHYGRYGRLTIIILK